MATSEKIQLKGASAYKKDLQQIAAQSKALAAEMKMVKSSFDKSTTAEEKNEAIGKQLTKQIELQKQRVDMLTKAYEEEVKVSGAQSEASAKAYEALVKGQTALNKMEQENRELAQAEDEETAAAQKNEGAHSKLNGVLKTAGAAVAAVAAATAAAAKALWDCAKASGEWADSLITMSEQTGVSVDTLQKWDYAARFIDTDTDTMTKALAKVVKQQASAIKSGNDFVTTLDGQVIALRDSNGELKTSETVFYEMLDALGQIGDTTLQDAAAQDLFGKSFQEIKPLIDAGSEGLKQYGEEAESMGLILSGDAVNSLGEFDDEMERLKATMEVAGRELSLSFLPATQAVASSLTELASTVTKALADGFQESDVDTILDALFAKLSEGLNNLSGIMPAAAKFVTGLVNKIVSFVTQNGPLLMNTALQIILGIANGFAESLPVMIPSIVDMVMTIVNTLMAPENVTLLMDAAIALMQGLGQGIINATPVLISQLPTLVMNMVQSLIAQAPKMFQLGPKFISQFGLGMLNAIGGLGNQLKAWITEKIINVAKNMTSNMSPVGKAMVEGLWKGISDKMAWIKSQISKWVGSVVDWFKKKLGIHSPSSVMADQIGFEMSRGIAVGISDGMSYVRTALATVPTGTGAFSLDASPAGMGGVTVYIDGIKYNTDEYVDTSITNFVENMVRRSQMYGRS